MLYLTAQSQIYLALQPVDFRRQIDGLVAHCENTLNTGSRSGALFVFINRAKTMIRILSYQDNGYWLMTKRLSRGRYHGWPKKGASLTSIEAARLMLLLKAVVAEGSKIK